MQESVATNNCRCQSKGGVGGEGEGMGVKILESLPSFPLLRIRILRYQIPQLQDGIFPKTQHEEDRDLNPDSLLDFSSKNQNQNHRNSKKKEGGGRVSVEKPIQVKCR